MCTKKQTKSRQSSYRTLTVNTDKIKEDENKTDNTSPEIKTADKNLIDNTSPDIKTADKNLTDNTSPDIKTADKNLTDNTSPDIKTADKHPTDENLTEKKTYAKDSVEEDDDDLCEYYEFKGNKFKIFPKDFLPDIDEEAIVANLETMNIPYNGNKEKFDWDTDYLEDVTGRQETVLIICQNPNQGKTVAYALSGYNFKTRSGICDKCPVYEFKKEFHGKMSKIKVTSVNNHIQNRFFESGQSIFTYDKNQKHSDLFDEKLVYATTDSKSNLAENLKAEAADCDKLVLWMNNDREGENICFQILEVVRDHLPAFPNFVSTPRNPQNIFRAKAFSAQQEHIRTAYEQLYDAPDYRESSCYNVRNSFELKVGMTFGRIMNFHLKKKFPRLYQKQITFAISSTPILSLCVQQYEKVQAFEEEKYWTFNPHIMIGSEVINNLDWKGTKIFDEEEAKNIKQQIDKISEIEVIKLETRKVVHPKPPGLNIISQLKYATKKQGINPAYIMQMVEKCYLWGYISYPRTEATSYREDFDFERVLFKFSQLANRHSADAEFLLENMQNPVEGNGILQISPIIPTGFCPKNDSLNSAGHKIYDYICHHFFASISEDMVVEETEVTFQIANQTFTVIGRETLEEGYTKYIPDIDFEEQLIPEFEQGEKYCISKTELLENLTEAPELFTESDIITLMGVYLERLDLQIVTQMSYLTEKALVTIDASTRQMEPTKVGIAMVRGFAKIDPGLNSPSLRASIEERINAIVDKKLDHEKVLDNLLQFFKEKFENFEQKITFQDEEFAKYFSRKNKFLQDSAPFSECGKCGNLMKIVMGCNKIYCAHCDVNLSLPKYAKYTKPDGIIDPKKYCPYDKFEIIYYEYDDDGLLTKLTVCPQCFTQPMFDIEGYRLTCSNCPSTECEFSKMHTIVRNCLKCKKGELILNKIVGNKLSLSCNNNNCRFITTVSKNAISAELSADSCECSARLLDIKFSNGNDFHSCVFCDKESKALMDDNKGFSPTKQQRKHKISLDQVRELFNDDGYDNLKKKLYI